jgi:uncharacterized spore protein YtfJ
MENMDVIIKTTLDQIEKILNTKRVIGEPVKVENATIIPLIRMGFGFGFGGGSGQGKKHDEGDTGSGNGLGGGGGVRPVALIVIDKDGVHFQPVNDGKSSFIEKMSDAIPKIVNTIEEKRKTDKKD